MATTIKTKNSTTAATAPTGLVQGELAVNITDKKLYVGDASGNSIQIAGQGATNGAGGSNTQVQYNSSGALAGSANLTFDGSQLSVYGITVGRGAGAVSTNTAVGASALAANTTGNYNTAIGYNALIANTTGVENSSLGLASLYSNTTGNYNTALGRAALFNNTTASNNTAVGYQAGYSQTTNSGQGMVAVGYQALYANTTGQSNTAVGSLDGGGTAVMRLNTTGSYNSAFGGGALQGNTTGGNNTALGYQALPQNTTASNNTAVGYQAGYTNTTGIQNIYVGYRAGYTNNSSSSTFLGFQAGLNATGDALCIVGQNAGLNQTSGGSNTYIGTNAGYSMTTGSKNTIIGQYNGNQGGLDIRTLSNFIVLSDGDGNPRLVVNNDGNCLIGATSASGRLTVTGSGATGGTWAAYITNSTPTQTFGVRNDGAIYLGLASASPYNNTTASGANAVLVSDGFVARSTSALKYKQDIRDLESIDINKFRPVRYKSKCENDDQTKDHFGIVADEVDQAGITELVNYGANGEVEGFQYERLTVVLLKAIQELKAEVDSLKQQLGK